MLHNAPPPRSAWRLPTAWVGLLLPATTYVAAWSFATSQQDPSGRAEARYLALMIAVAIAIQASLDPRRGRSLVATAGLVLTALLTLGAGTTRGAVCMAILAAGLAYAARERWRRDLGRLSFGMAVALSMAIQLFARPRLLLDTSVNLTHVAMVLVAVPTVIGVCASLLARRSGSRIVLIASGTVAVLVPGWNESIATLFLALVGVAWLRSTIRSATVRDGSWGVRNGLALLAGGSLLVLPLAWHGWVGAWPVGLAASLAAVAWAGHSRSWPATRRGRVGVAISISVAAWAAAWASGPRGDSVQLFATAALLLSLLPTLGIPLLRGLTASRSSTRYAVLCLLPAASLLILASRTENARVGLAGVAALIVLSQPRRGAWLALQGWWTGMVVVLASLLVAYPWTRLDALGDALALFGLGSFVVVATFVALFTLSAWLWRSLLGGPRLWGQRLWDQRTTWPFRWTGRAVSTATVIGLLVASTPPPGAVFVPATALTAAKAEWRAPLPSPMTARRVVVDSIAANSMGLLPGSVIGTIQLLDAELETIAEWSLISGEHTAEWAVERPDVAAAMGDVAPAPYAASVVPNGIFFARWFRARFVLETPVAHAAHVVIRLASNVPDGMQIVLQRVAVLP